MAMVESIFKLDDTPRIIYNRKKEDFIKIAPTTSNAENLNRAGAITFELNNQQSFMNLSESFFMCDFEIKKADGTALGNDNITLEHNFFPRLFSQMTLEVGTQQLETINNVGVADTILRFISRDKSFKEDNGEIQGWIPDVGNAGVSDALDLNEGNIITLNQSFAKRKQLYNTTKKFQLKWDLAPLFGYLDFRKITYQLKLKISLLRQFNNESIFFGTVATNAKIVIESLNLWIPQITPSPEVELMVMKRLNTNKPIDVVFLKRTCVSVSTETRTTFDWQIANISNQPRYLFVAFQSNAASSFQTNESKFTMQGIKRLRVSLNQTNYPQEAEQVSFDDFKIAESFIAYERICLDMGVSPQLSVREFRDIYPIFCFDLTAQNEDLKKNGINIRLHIEKDNTNLIAYALLLEETYHQIQVINGVMTRID